MPLMVMVEAVSMSEFTAPISIMDLAWGLDWNRN